MNESDLPVTDMHPYRWGDPERRAELPDAVKTALAQLGVREPAEQPPDVGEISLPPVALTEQAMAAIEDVLGRENVRTAQEERVGHTRGWSTPDLLKLRSGDATDAPDAVVFPGTHDEVVFLLEVCTEHRVAVVPFSGGTSVVGGLAPRTQGFNGVITLDLSRMDALLAVDEMSRTATLQAGMRGPRVEHLLGERGFTLGHFPQSYEGASVGGFAAARSAGQASAGFGRFDEMVVGITLATPLGTVELGSAPMSAAGPDLRQLVLGSEGTLGVITSVTVRVRPRPDERIYEGWKFDSFDSGSAALRALAQEGPLPTVVRLSDETETAVNLADPNGEIGSGPGGCLAITGYEGTAAEVASRRKAASALLAGAGGEPLGEGAGEAWRQGRYRTPYLRDPLLDAGALVETLETATFWSHLDTLRTAVADAVTATLAERGTPALALCHISHVYETGASLYFTVVCAQSDDPVAQWQEAKSAANEAIRSAGGTITHHHGVGLDHRESYTEEIGELAVGALRAAKHTLDPGGILNPGVLMAP